MWRIVMLTWRTHPRWQASADEVIGASFFNRKRQLSSFASTRKSAAYTLLARSLNWCVRSRSSRKRKVQETCGIRWSLVRSRGDRPICHLAPP